ncbi:MAG TPA: hypothetical protein VFX91_12095 [Alcanivorax sp.]|nr:hypothetical protein [Alcanivorax sp.]
MSEDNRYHVRLTGELMAGADAGQVAANLARLFKMPQEKAALLVSGTPRVVKKDADEATARKFQVALRQAGARCELLPVNGETASAAPQPAAAAPQAEASEAVVAPAASADQRSGDIETVGTIRTGGTGFSGAFEVAPVGADLDTSERGQPAAAPDISHLSMAEPGADLEPLKQEREAVVPDISHLSIKPD